MENVTCVDKNRGGSKGFYYFWNDSIALPATAGVDFLHCVYVCINITSLTIKIHKLSDKTKATAS